MGDVVYLGAKTCEVDFTQEQVLAHAAKVDLSGQSMVIGFGANRDLYYVSSTADLADIIYLLERIKKMVMEQDC